MWHKIAPRLAQDQITVMRHFGVEDFFVVGHDRGGCCTYGMTLDHPQRVLKLAVLDIIPTGEAFRRTNMAFGLGFWHWFFLAQPYDLPERLIGAHPDTIHAMCEDYRAWATIDYMLDETDRSQRRITCPILALWSLQGELQDWYDVLAIWRDWVDDVQGYGINCGHYLAEEATDETYAALHTFLTA